LITIVPEAEARFNVFRVVLVVVGLMFGAAEIPLTRISPDHWVDRSKWLWPCWSRWPWS
jgi:hypothetical protein